MVADISRDEPQRMKPKPCALLSFVIYIDLQWDREKWDHDNL